MRKRLIRPLVALTLILVAGIAGCKSPTAPVVDTTEADLTPIESMVRPSTEAAGSPQRSLSGYAMGWN